MKLLRDEKSKKVSNTVIFSTKITILKPLWLYRNI